jgi:hypothetical protein
VEKLSKRGDRTQLKQMNNDWICRIFHHDGTALERGKTPNIAILKAALAACQWGE